MDLQLNNSGDLDLAGDLSFVRGVDSVKQRLRIRLLTFSGEWFLNTDAGLPYRQEILVKNPDIAGIQAIFRREINDCPGVVSVVSISLDYDPVLRSLDVTFTAVLDTATTGTTTATAILSIGGGESLLLWV